tara:strand:+ start:145 stop:879 length:735 start_codon:yes stop_codon:yes gene_type:complete
LKGIVLAAGRGSRLSQLTDEVPKCMMTLNGEYILDKIARTFKLSGIDDLTIITGYKCEKIETLGYKTIYNEDWSCGNIVSSLVKGFSKVQDEVIVSYSDILFEEKAIENLKYMSSPIAITYDPDWLELWKSRSDDPLSDAETFRIDQNNKLLEIGKKPEDLSKIKGQFMGLLRFTKEGIQIVQDFIEKNPEARLSFDTTTLLSHLIDEGIDIQATEYTNGWTEIDTPTDLHLASTLIDRNKIKV